MGAEKGNPILKMILNYYECILFDENNLIPNTKIISDIFKLFIKQKCEDGKIILYNDCNLYPSEYFAPYDHCNRRPTPTENTHTIHHFQGSWLKE
jgi:hypothetical protein